MTDATLHALLGFFPVMLLINAIEVRHVRLWGTTKTVFVMGMLGVVGVTATAFGSVFVLFEMVLQTHQLFAAIFIWILAFLSALLAGIIGVWRYVSWLWSQESDDGPISEAKF